MACNLLGIPSRHGSDQEGRAQTDFGVLKAAVCMSLLSFSGIVISITLTAVQDFDCKASKKALLYNAVGLQNAMGSNVRRQQTSLEPPIPGNMAGRTKPRLVFAAEPNWAPYVFINTQTGLIEGVAVDMARGIGEMCDFDISITQTEWTECWADDAVGKGLRNGDYHACMTYVHSRGSRDRQMDFSHAVLRGNSRSTGLLVRLKADGMPEVDGSNNFANKKIVYTSGWAPSKDGVGFVINSCTGERFANYTMVPSSPTLPNNDALSKLLDGSVDAMWLHGDHDEDYKTAGCTQRNPNKTSSYPDWDCAKWAGFGTKFAFVQTGMSGHAINGTTLAVFKKGSGLDEIINPCIDRYMGTKEYYEVCAKYDIADECYPNAFFPTEYFTSATPVWDIPTKDLPTSCATGYCPCPSLV